MNDLFLKPNDRTPSSHRDGREQIALTDRRSLIASGDLDIPVFGQLPTTELALRYHLEPRALEMERLDARFGCRTLIEEPLEDPAGDPDNALVGTEDNAELYGVVLFIPAGIFGKLKKQHCDLLGEGSGMFLFCSDPPQKTRRRRGESGAVILITGSEMNPRLTHLLMR
jgi:hypothetical protein